MEGQVVVITGGSQGIGKALALNLAAKGCKIVIAARTLETLNNVVKECGGEGVAIGVVMDVTKKSDHESLLIRAVETFGRVDVWVNNAGAGLCKLTLDLTDEDIDQMMNINCKSALYGMQTVIPYFKQQLRGQVINVSTRLSRLPMMVPLYAMYSASKAALNSLTITARLDLKNAGFSEIHVSLFLPGLVATDFGVNAINSTHDNKAMPWAQPVDDAAEKLVQQIITKKPDMYSKEEYLKDIAEYYSATDVSVLEGRPPYANAYKK